MLDTSDGVPGSMKAAFSARFLQFAEVPQRRKYARFDEKRRFSTKTRAKLGPQNY